MSEYGRGAAASSSAPSASAGGGGGDFLKNLAEQKLKSFSIGTMGKRALSRKEQEELKKKQEEEDVGKVYQEFVSTFEENNASKVPKTWIKAGTFNAGNRKEDHSGKGQLYKPTSRYSSNEKEKEPPKAAPPELLAKRPEKPGKKKQSEKKKSNLEIFKEELKAMQEEREERHRIKGLSKGSSSSSAIGSVRSDRESLLYGDGGGRDTGSHDNGDPNTTNLYLGNLSPRLTEQQLMELFGKYGPLASIKIMWPRTEDEKSRGRNCGFVAYMARSDGERALVALMGKHIDGFEMKMGWGKPVPIPLHPVYVPPKLLKLTMPPSASGLPFNCQPSKEDAETWGIGKGEPIKPPQSEEEDFKFKRLLRRSTVKVVIPTDRTTLCLINRMVEFVVREGPMFEAMIMNREMTNRSFAFLFENKSPEHIYYRWRLFSLLQGDNKDNWSTKDFQMFKGGSVWRPPPMNLYTSGMPEELIEKGSDEEAEERSSSRKRRQQQREAEQERGSERSSRHSRKGLSDSQRDRFEDMLRGLYPDRNPVAEAMVWCIEHADAGEEIVECISEALSIPETPLSKKVARLYLISDILHNCSVKGVPNVSFYRKGFQSKLPDVFNDLKTSHQAVESRMKAEAFKQRVMACFRAWEDWALYPQDFLIKLQNIFLGLVRGEGENNDSGNNQKEDDVDGKSMSEDEDVDGVPLDGAALLKRGGPATFGGTPSSASLSRGGGGRGSDDDSDVDGAPMRPDAAPHLHSPPKPVPSSASAAHGFVPSKWETVDPVEVQAQAVTSKWDIFDQQPQQEEEEDEGRGSRRKAVTEPDDEYDDDDDVDGIPLVDYDSQVDVRLSEDRRARLREVELKVMTYQDELETGRQAVKPGWTISEQVDQYRKKLLKAAGKSSSHGDVPDPTSFQLSSSSKTPSRRGDRDTDDEHNGDDDDIGGRSSSSRKSRSSKKKSKKSRQRSSSSSRSRSRSRSRERKRGRRSRRSRSRSAESDSSSSSSSTSHRRRKRSRSRSPTSSSAKKKKKKRH